jgi:hypothetical protein
MMQRPWQALGHAPPINTNDRVYKSFAPFLRERRAFATPEAIATEEALAERHLDLEIMKWVNRRKWRVRSRGASSSRSFRERGLSEHRGCTLLGLASRVCVIDAGCPPKTRRCSRRGAHIDFDMPPRRLLRLPWRSRRWNRRTGLDDRDSPFFSVYYASVMVTENRRPVVKAIEATLGEGPPRFDAK